MTRTKVAGKLTTSKVEENGKFSEFRAAPRDQPNKCEKLGEKIIATGRKMAKRDMLGWEKA